MNATEFRRTLRLQLDKAAQGQVITIKRGGLIFELRASWPVLEGAETDSTKHRAYDGPLASPKPDNQNSDKIN